MTEQQQENLDSHSFEERIERIEEVLLKLEEGELPLEKSVELYEEGVRLLSSCYETLDKMEGKIMKLVRTDDGDPTREPFEEGGRAGG
ncbi:MAG: exodeoxyribonuclease VII small subunit [Planctomycetota bacterium]|nr:exodeoxyribonuclease VII small subunit [Planctomycetota bacterium]